MYSMVKSIHVMPFKVIFALVCLARVLLSLNSLEEPSPLKWGLEFVSVLQPSFYKILSPFSLFAGRPYFRHRNYCQPIKVLKSKWCIWFCLLICGDIEANPGPFPCSVCVQEVQDDQQGLYCEVCFNWNHRACVNMSEPEYFHWANIDDGWVCPKCDQEALPFYDATFLSSTIESSFHSSQMIMPKNNSLRILSFNARSLLPKIDLLRALCLNEPYDLLIVTETWLSLDILNSEIRISGFDIARKDRSVLNALNIWAYS